MRYVDDTIDVGLNRKDFQDAVRIDGTRVLRAFHRVLSTVAKEYRPDGSVVIGHYSGAHDKILPFAAWRPGDGWYYVNPDVVVWENDDGESPVEPGMGEPIPTFRTADKLMALDALEVAFSHIRTLELGNEPDHSHTEVRNMLGNAIAVAGA